VVSNPAISSSKAASRPNVRSNTSAVTRPGARRDLYPDQ
jgi:hypothetical protein